MKIIFVSFFLLILISLGCRKEIVSSNEFEIKLLKAAVTHSIPQFQSNEETNLLKSQRIKSMSYVVENLNTTEADSLTYIELDEEGRILRRTTIENTTAGCLPYMLRQEFSYADNKIQRVTNYTFKYKASSVLENWLLTDTTKLLMFDWEDYTYNGDTIMVESGYAWWKFVKDDAGNIIYRQTVVKANNQTMNSKYEYSGLSVIIRHHNSADPDSLITQYTVSDSGVLVKSKVGTKEFLAELEYDPSGLLISRTYHFDKGNEQLKSVITYSYY